MSRTVNVMKVLAKKRKLYEKDRKHLRLGSHLGKKRKKKYSNKFNTMFWFFLKSYRKGILTFSGSVLKVHKGEEDSKLCFQKYENGEYKTKPISSRHPNVLFSVITAKKSLGLFFNEWSSGIAEGLFTKKEILEEFSSRGIEMPESLLIDFENRIHKKVIESLQKSID